MLKYDFITTVTHKFRTPLTGIKWATENLSTLPLTPEGQTQIDYIKNSTEKLVELTNLLVATSETEKVSYNYNLTKNNISTITNDVIVSLSNQIGMKGLKIEKNLQENIFAICDQNKIQFVIQTLIENAIHYTKEGGNINIETKIQNNNAIFSIHDTGIGMNKGELNLIFSKFYRTAEARAIDTEGMGVGLFIAKEIINRHKGKIWAESDGIDKGSTFIFSLSIKE